MAKGTKVQPRIRGTNLMTIYGLSEVSCVIPNISSYLDDDTWAKVVKGIAPGIRNMKVVNVAYIFTISLYIYLTM